MNVYIYIHLHARLHLTRLSALTNYKKYIKIKINFHVLFALDKWEKNHSVRTKIQHPKSSAAAATAQEEMNKNWNGEIGKRRWVKEKAMHTLKQHLHRSGSSFFFVAFFVVALTAVMAVAVANYLHFLQNTIKKRSQLKTVCSVYINPLAQKCYRFSFARFVATRVFAISCLQCLPSTSAHFERCSLILLFSAAETYFRIHPL